MSFSPYAPENVDPWPMTSRRMRVSVASSSGDISADGMGGVHVVGGGCCEAPTSAGAAESCRAWHMRAVIFHQIRRSRGICRNLFTYGMFLSFAITQKIPEIPDQRTTRPLKSSDPIKNLRFAWTRQHRVRYLVAALWRFGPDSDWTAIGKKREIEPVSAESHVVAEKFSEAKSP